MARITKKEAAEIARLRKNMAAKLHRLGDRGIANLPQLPRITEKNSRAEVNQAKDFMRSFTNRGNMRWQYEESGSGEFIDKRTLSKLKRETKRVNDLIKRNQTKYDNLPFTPRSEYGKGLGGYRTVKDDKQKEKARYYKDKKAKDFESPNEAYKRLKRLESLTADAMYKHDELFRENFNKALQKVHGDNASELIERVNLMSLDDFMLLIHMQDIDIAFVYTDADKQNALDELDASLHTDRIGQLIADID